MTMKLKRYREATNKSVDEMADVFGINRTTLWRWEKGRVPAERVIEIERVTGIGRAELRPDIFGAA